MYCNISGGFPKGDSSFFFRLFSYSPFCDTLAAILKAAKTEQHKNRFRYGELYHLNYYTKVKEKDHT